MSQRDNRRRSGAEQDKHRQQHGLPYEPFRSGGRDGGAPPREQQQGFDPDYRQWRSQQMRDLDDDYRGWRDDRYKKFSDEFSTWRKNRSEPAGQSLTPERPVGSSRTTDGAGKK